MQELQLGYPFDIPGCRILTYKKYFPFFLIDPFRFPPCFVPFPGAHHASESASVTVNACFFTNRTVTASHGLRCCANFESVLRPPTRRASTRPSSFVYNSAIRSLPRCGFTARTIADTIYSCIRRDQARLFGVFQNPRRNRPPSIMRVCASNAGTALKQMKVTGTSAHCTR